MIKNLFNFSYVKDSKEAVLFFFVFLVIYLISSALIQGLIAVTLFGPNLYGNNFSQNLFEDDLFNKMRPTMEIVTRLISGVFSLTISLLILKSKNLLNKRNYLLLSLLSGIFGLIITGSGLIIAAYLTTRRK
jgi:uncharacterized membrane protein YpjA